MHRSSYNIEGVARLALAFGLLVALLGASSVYAVPCIDLEKQISVDGGETFHDANADDEQGELIATFPTDAVYRFIVRNCGQIGLRSITIQDGDDVVDVDGRLLGGESATVEISVANVCTEATTITNTATATGMNRDMSASDTDSAVLVCEDQGGDGAEGCTPGYWRNHTDSWVGFETTEDYATVFDVDASFSTDLLGAVRQGGGGENALGRHAVAALLNSANSGVDFAFDTDEVIRMVQDAYDNGDFEGTKDALEDENEQGCPLN